MKKIIAKISIAASLVALMALPVLAAGLPSIITLPTIPNLISKELCKNDGWKTFTGPEFRNQGLCVAYSNYLNRTITQNVAWNLSGAVMPVPPYGSLDIPGSDAASKLTVTHILGTDPTIIKGEMAGLHPNTTYTVYISNSYVPYVETG